MHDLYQFVTPPRSNVRSRSLVGLSVHFSPNNNFASRPSKPTPRRGQKFCDKIAPAVKPVPVFEHVELVLENFQNVTLINSVLGMN